MFCALCLAIRKGSFVLLRLCTALSEHAAAFLFYLSSLQLTQYATDKLHLCRCAFCRCSERNTGEGCSRPCALRYQVPRSMPGRALMWVSMLQLTLAGESSGRCCSCVPCALVGAVGLVHVRVDQREEHTKSTYLSAVLSF